MWDIPPLGASSARNPALIIQLPGVVVHFLIHFASAEGRISRVTLQRNEANGDGVSPFVELDRQTWSRLAAQMEQPLNEEDVFRLRGLGDPLDMKEVREVYLPLSRLLHLYVEAPGSSMRPPPRSSASRPSAPRS
jgi:hypothetical protein